MLLSTSSHLTEEALWATSPATRLRLLQVNFADDSPATRHDYLHEEVQRAVKDITPGNRRAHLEALRERFPSWQGSQRSPAVAGPIPAPVETPEEALDKLLELSGTLTPEAKAAFSRRLQAAGFTINQGGGGGLPEVSPEVQKKHGLAPGQQLHPERTIKLLVGLAEMVLALDQLVWTLWKPRN